MTELTHERLIAELYDVADTDSIAANCSNTFYRRRIIAAQDARDMGWIIACHHQLIN